MLQYTFYSGIFTLFLWMKGWYLIASGGKIIEVLSLGYFQKSSEYFLRMYGHSEQPRPCIIRILVYN